ncbi:hypothetical protein GQ457_01G015760 [Hibiscus cannabinus]
MEDMEAYGSNESFEDESSGFDSMEELQEAIRRDLIVDNMAVMEDNVIIDRIGLFPVVKIFDHIHEQIDTFEAPYKYYSKALFRMRARCKFTSLAILVDLTQPLILCIDIDNFIQKLEYEGLQNICYSCGVYGHSKESCSKNPPDSTDPAPAGKDDEGGALGLRFVALEIEELDNQAHATANKVLHNKNDKQSILMVIIVKLGSHTTLSINDPSMGGQQSSGSKSSKGMGHLIDYLRRILDEG